MLSFEFHSLVCFVSLFVVLYDLCFSFNCGSVPVDLGEFVLFRYVRSIDEHDLDCPDINPRWFLMCTCTASSLSFCM